MKILFLYLAIYTGKQYPKTIIKNEEIYYEWNGRK